MRNLTIKRTKSFVGCLLTVHVYVQDYTAPETYINNVPCRKLGTVKNGEEKTFLIPAEETAVYVVSDRTSKSIAHDFVRLPAGYDPVYLTGRCHSITGFQFDGVTDEVVLQDRKKSKRKGAVVLAVALVVGFALGFLANLDTFLPASNEPKAFTVQEMRITLTKAFDADWLEGFDGCFTSRDVAVMVLREDFTDWTEENPADYTAEDYAELMAEVNELGATVQMREGLACLEYDITDEGETYSYLAVAYKSAEAFWFVQFGVQAEDMATYHDTFLEWAKTVTFDPA